ncbi:hypothetical protein ACFYWY_37245 [Streptomyces sp. NPDC002870]|uniref:hypothetical protein n=1 Tax=Streptomyces sp. NPDC002870 TaxID=3364666 RepID=UPI00367CCC0E
MAVGAQGDHLRGVVTAALSDPFDVVNFQDRLAVVGDIGWLTAARGVLTTALCAHQHGPPSIPEADRITADSLAAAPVGVSLAPLHFSYKGAVLRH